MTVIKNDTKNPLRNGGSRIKVGIVSYLNTRPLIYGLKLEPIASQIELIEDNPARLAEMLKNDEIDLGLIPVAAISELKASYLSGRLLYWYRW